jgi:two-component system OmpR family sensor kinase
MTIRASQVVLWQVAQDQMNNLGLATGGYLNGLSAAVLPSLVRRDAGKVFDALDRARRGRYAGFEPRFAILELPNGTILASSDPRRFPVESAVPDELHRRFAAGDGLKIDLNTDRAWLAKTLRAEGFPVGRLFAEVDIAASRAEILLMAVLLVNGCLMTLAFALDGFVLKRIFEFLETQELVHEQIRH